MHLRHFWHHFIFLSEGFRYAVYKPSSITCETFFMYIYAPSPTPSPSPSHLHPHPQDTLKDSPYVSHSRTKKRCFDEKETINEQVSTERQTLLTVLAATTFHWWQTSIRKTTKARSLFMMPWKLSASRYHPKHCSNVYYNFTRPTSVRRSELRLHCKKDPENNKSYEKGFSHS